MDWYGFFWAIQETWSWHIMIFDVKKSGFCFLPELLLLNSSICQLLLDGARTALLGFHPNWSGDSPQFHGSPHLVVNEYDFFSTCQWFFRDIYIYCQYNIFLGMYMYIIIYIYTVYHLIPFNWRICFPHSIYLCHPPGEITGITGITVALHFDGCSLGKLNQKRHGKMRATYNRI